MGTEERMAHDKEVTLMIENQEFKLKKCVLSEHSDYFRAMFSGNYLEKEKQQIVIDVIDADSMKIIIQYMEVGLIDLFEYSLDTIAKLGMVANFLQITELVKQIEYTLELRLSRKTWIKIVDIADRASFLKLEQYATAYGLLNFRNMEINCIKTPEKLYWYLSHPYLDAGSELEVFKFGLNWANSKHDGGDLLMLVLCCLDINRTTTRELEEMKKLMDRHELSLAAKVVDCLLYISTIDETIALQTVLKNKDKLCEKFTERVYREITMLVKESKSRRLTLTPAIPFWTKKDLNEEKRIEQKSSNHHYLYTFADQSGFQKWLEVAEKNLWGWSVASWDSMKLIVVCGEHGRGTGIFMKDVKVYDVLKKEWTYHGVQMPSTRHASLTVLQDSLFIIGGVGSFRVTLDKTIVYDLKERTYREVAKFPDAIQNPAVCTHEGKVYAAGLGAIYQYEDIGDSDAWHTVIRTNLRLSCMTSFKGYIYCIQTYFSNLYRFQPNMDQELEIIANFTNPPANLCNLGDRILFFTRPVCGQADSHSVEEYTGKGDVKDPRVIWQEEDSELVTNDVPSGSCSLLMEMPPIHRDITENHGRYLRRCSQMF